MCHIVYKQSFNTRIHRVTFKDNNITFTIHPSNIQYYQRLANMTRQYAQQYKANMKPISNTINTKSFIKSSGCFITISAPNFQKSMKIETPQELALLPYWNKLDWIIEANTVAKIVYDQKIIELQIICYDYTIRYNEPTEPQLLTVSV